MPGSTIMGLEGQVWDLVATIAASSSLTADQRQNLRAIAASKMREDPDAVWCADPRRSTIVAPTFERALWHAAGAMLKETTA